MICFFFNETINKRQSPTLDKKKTITIFHQNIAGILNKRDIFETVIIELSQTLGDIDVICLSETFLKRGTETNLILNSYLTSTSYSRINQRRGGVCILLKETLIYKVIKIDSSPHSFEGCAVELVEFGVIVLCVYRTPASNALTFLQKLQSILPALIRKKNKQIILCGDWNIDILKESKYSKELISVLRNFGIVIHIKNPTRQNSCIDLIASNIQNVTARTHLLALSDHETGQTISFTGVKTSELNKKTTFWFETKLDYNKENIQKFLQCISSLSFIDVFEKKTSEEAFNTFHDLFTLFHKLCFPEIKVKVVNKGTKNKWLTKSLKRCCVKKRCLYLKYKSSASNKKYNKAQYTIYNKILKNCLLQTQKIQNCKQIASSQNICKAAWNIIKRNTEYKSKVDEIQEVKIDNDIYTNPNEICEQFNKYYLNLTSQSSNSNKNPENKINHNLITNPNTIFLTPIDSHDMFNFIKSLKNKNSTGYDLINTKMIKLSSTYISSPLCYIVNLCLTEGHFPNRLKYSIVKPLYKKGKRIDINNYRPITLIPILSKVFEKVIYSKLYCFLDQYNILSNKQYGFRKGFSTTFACFTLIKHVTESLNNKMLPISIFLDMTKAFDYVCHNNLLDKMYCYGIRGKAWDLLESYLSNRQQCTEITRIVNKTRKNFRSTFSINRYGIPQGSVLGPLLFLIYINDLPHITTHDCILFADDTTITLNSTKGNEKNDIIKTLENINNWMTRNNLIVNIEKTNIIQFQTNTRIFKDKLFKHVTFNNKIINCISSTRFLGIYVDNFCNWKDQIDILCNKLDRFVYVLRRIKDISSQNTSVLAYNGYVSSLLRYCIVIWGNSVEVHRVFVAQKKCVRAICGASYLDSCRPLFKKLNVLPLPCLYIFESAVFVQNHKYIYLTNGDMKYRSERYKNKLYMPPQRLTLFSKNCYCMSIRIYNHLPNTFTNLTINVFKKRLFNLLIDKLYYTINDFLSDKIDI